MKILESWRNFSILVRFGLGIMAHPCCNLAIGSIVENMWIKIWQDFAAAATVLVSGYIVMG